MKKYKQLIKNIKGKTSNNIEGALIKVKKIGIKKLLLLFLKKFISSNKFIIIIIIKKTKLTFKNENKKFL